MNTINENNYVDKAEAVINGIRGDRKYPANRMTTTQIRKILSVSADIEDQAKADTGQGDVLNEKLQGKLNHLRVLVVYQAGRKDEVKSFVEKANLLAIIKEIGNSKKNLLLFCRYMEALVAYHRYLGGKDK
jgi:CRISPR-associated protein Csm2